MLDETMTKIERQIQQGSLDVARKAELLHLLATLRAEVEATPLAQAEQAQSISAFAALSAHEATRKKTQAKLLEFSLGGLAASAQELEVTHPRLAEVANQLCALLSSMGI